MTPTIDLSPQELDLILYSGDGIRFRLVITDKDDQPVNVTGEVKAQIRARRGTPATEDPEAEFDVDMSQADTGIITLTLTGAHTQALTPNPGKRFVGAWDVEWTPLDSQPRTLCQGKVECYLDVTR